VCLSEKTLKSYRKSPRANITYSETPERWPANPAALRPESQGFEDVTTGANPTIDMKSDPASGSPCTIWKNVDRGRDIVQLPTTMIANENPIAAVLDGELDILSRQDAFDPDLHSSHTSQPRDLLRPGVRIRVEGGEAIGVIGAVDLGVEIIQHGEFQVTRNAEVGSFLVVSPTQHRTVRCQKDSPASRCLGAADQTLLDGTILQGVHLHGVRDGTDRAPGGDDLFDRIVREG
jgi:hypothetical protein